MNSMLFRDYIELLFKAYLEDRKLIDQLRQRVKTPDYIAHIDELGASLEWKQLLPLELRNSTTVKTRYFPNKLNPQEGIRVFEAAKVDPCASTKFKKLVKLRLWGQ